jgi:hypothetical protein
MAFRSLSAEQIRQLSAQGCTCADWSKVKAAEGFEAGRVRNTQFSGEIRLGRLDKEVKFFGGIVKPAQITNATIHNCRIGDNVYIDQVRNYIANYVIENDVVIDNVDMMAVNGQSSFGNGTEVTVLNEAGGREIPIHDKLSAHLAYVIALYRHRPKLIAKLREMIAAYASSVTSEMGLLGMGATLVNCRTIKNVRIGPHSTIEGVDRLENGSINSCEAAPVYVGPSVIAEDFIISSGSTVTDGTIISKCFVGQSCKLAKQYSAENSVFFANCGGYHGEACSIFAGPYTVTHHKSTLLIAGLFSFLNAGSGSNQSNHMYKLGPVHQGVVERGSKTTSDSYVLWPAKIGPFTLVMGRHYRNSDTSDMPFSYLIEHEDESILVPGVNLRSVGTIRDARKWPQRDNRKDPEKLDHINFNLLSPFTIQKMLNGAQILENLRKTSGEHTDYYTYNSVKIHGPSLKHGIDFYNMGITKFLGNSLLTRLEGRRFKSDDEIRARLKPDTKTGLGQWVDMAGLIAPEQLVNKLLDDIEAGKVRRLEQVNKSFKSMADNYYTYEWTWAIDVLQKRIGKEIGEITAMDVAQLTRQWNETVVKLDRMLAEDARKEFAGTAQIGYGIDDADEARRGDFAEVRGTYEKNGFVLEIEKHIEAKSALADDLLARIKSLL